MSDSPTKVEPMENAGDLRRKVQAVLRAHQLGKADTDDGHK